MNFNPTISLGNIINIIVIAGGIGMLIVTMKNDLNSLKGRLDNVEILIGKLADALIQLATQEVRLDAHDKRLDRLEVKD